MFYSRNKICMIIPYFGRFPEWFNLYLYSCSKVNIDFYFFTDCKLPSKIYKNTHFTKLSYKQYCQIVSEKLNLNFQPDNRYNLVKIRPFIGLIHHDICSKYLFWGYSDIDLIYGNINQYLTDQILSKYNLITTHSTRVAGHFTIIKTKSKYTTICLDIPNWKEKLETEKIIAVDESDFTKVVNPALKYMNAIYFRIFRRFLSDKWSSAPKLFQYMQSIYRFFTHYDCLFNECFTSPIPTKEQVWQYDTTSNKILTPKTYPKSNIVYLHFIFFKKTDYLRTNYEWKKGFYKIPRNFGFNRGKWVDISYRGIQLHGENKRKINDC